MHRLYRDACYYKNGIHMKDLSKLNRNTNKIVYLDDDVRAAQLNPQNLIRVKPYDDPTDRNDTTLERITPFLIEIAKEGYDNIPQVLRQFQGMDSDEIADEMDRRVADLRNVRVRGAQRGLGALSGIGQRDLPTPEMTPVRSRAKAAAPGLTSKDLVGAAPPMAGESDGKGISGWLQRRQQEQQEEQMRKMEKWNEIMLKKQQDRAQKAAAN